jgi:integrase
MTWKLPQIEQYRERHALGTTARLAPELMLNVAARREDAYKLGRQHLSFDVDHRVWKLTWRPSKTLRSTGKTLTIPILPDLQAALYALPRSDALSYLTTDYGRPFASAAGFGEKFSEWCNVAGLQPVICDDGKPETFGRTVCARRRSIRSPRQAATSPNCRHSAVMPGSPNCGSTSKRSSSRRSAAWPMSPPCKPKREHRSG